MHRIICETYDENVTAIRIDSVQIDLKTMISISDKKERSDDLKL